MSKGTGYVKIYGYDKRFRKRLIIRYVVKDGLRRRVRGPHPAGEVGSYGG